jgi:hypothetical protein
MGHSELLSLLISLSSLVVVVAVLIGLFTAITKFIAQYGMFIFAAGLAYLMFQGAGVDMTWVGNVLDNLASNATALK